MLPASLATELDISQEEMDFSAEDIYSVCPGCTRVRFTAALVRSAIAHISNISVVEGHELQNVWFRMHHLDKAMDRVEERFGGDTTPPELGSPKHNVMWVINVCLDTLSYIITALNAYGYRLQAETQHHFSVFRHQLDNILTIIVAIIKAPVPLLKPEVPLLNAKDCHEGMKLPSDPLSSPQLSQAREGLDGEELSESPALTLDYDQPSPASGFQTQKGPENVHSSSPSWLESHDESWTFKMVQTSSCNGSSKS
ncbi:hypothetical protein NCS57_01327600 [Fusarium keratoplasticum]|uniref:Uncharacterized protein n=1 Tax=Fusarium keratoplasticum TaxID=1328300 RepID=A0ACC0QGM1_9HYPO|nr:hypothetical protein NCS57_01327600 [Fusarium keratoplasticum]KAI8652630.1 hypothetical protein NCS57_01327600 [Fusarium keratoplasticum]KAI8653351.1 hypothetical protein NCS55_01320800 [Fusarium keratoplasticum]